MAIKNKKIWISLLFTALFLFIYRFGYFIQIPFVKIEYVKKLFSSGESMFGFLDVFSGGALSNFSIVALGISPYITASIVIQLLQMDIVPVLKEWSEEGQVGKEKLNQLTRYLALGLAFVQALTLTIGISVTYNNALFGPGTPITPMTYIYLSLVMTAGTAFVLWIAERITQKGIGNGTSMIIVAGIIASFPDMINDLIQKYIISGGEKIGNIFIFFGVILLMILIIVGVIFIEAAQRKIPIQYANRPATASFRGKSDSNIPIKLNSASVIPVIFASTLMSLPTTISNFLTNATAKTWLTNIFSSSEPIGFVLYIVLIFVFSFFYAFLQMSPEKMAENLQKQNAYIPGIRPGDETAAYFSRVLFKITMVGATYLSIVASIPIIMSKIFKLPSSVQVGGTSLIIVVGVAIETVNQLKTQSQEKQYRGFID
ncbi:MAG TPA: preprotein translocase subunit SecY [Bacilli bacterium]|jgi:preprotein translocase subunit SecY|nr:preprotein translocase subunit SecY [Acholeplasmataceae bacterium]HNZ77410.1 preprotein translocase subunit SecY [Bacilli bacterium]HOD61603.1 preprotein translocase subunit SecY [Bacilli bacterium]HOH61615.1 preprotein translocase subunit SecY [Bacilli bacterium]HPB48819.1 preprotein translocase subunit SecY [Bacilli bacterium]